MKNNFFKTETALNVAKTASLVGFAYLLTNEAAAIPAGVDAVKAIGDKIMPYVTWATAIGGASIAMINGWRVFNGQPKAGVYALGGSVVAGLGFDSIFGAEVATLLLP